MPTADAYEWPQGQPLFETMWRSVTESLAGNGIVANGDFEVTATANAMEIEVAAGTYFASDSEYTLGTADTHTLTAGDGSHDRWDTVWFDTGTAASGVTDGTAQADPEPPDVTGDQEPLAFVYVPQNATDVPDSDVLNWRAQFSNEAEEVHYDDDTGVYGVSNVDAALDELQEAAQISAYPLAIADLASPYAPASIANVNGYPFQNGDLANSVITANAGTGLTTTNAAIGLGGSATISVDQTFAPTWTGQHTFDLQAALKEQASTPSTPTGGYVQAYPKGDGFLYAQDDAGRERRVHSDVKTGSVTADYTTAYEDVLFVDPSGTGGLTITLASGDARDGHGLTVIDVGGSAEVNPITIDTGGTETIDGGATKDIATDNAQLLLESDGSDWFTSGGAAAVGVNTDEFNTDESGTVNAGNSGVVYTHQVPDGGTLRVLRAGLLLADGQPAPGDLDLVIATLDNTGVATKQTTVIAGDGTVQATVTGDPVASYMNNSGGGETVALLVDNGNFNSGTGSNQDVAADCQGEVV
jgi:hypothetical protein